MKAHKLVGIFLSVMFVLSLTTPMVSVNAEPELAKLSVDPPIYTAIELGEVFIINIEGTNIVNLVSFEFKLSYNTTILDVISMWALWPGSFINNETAGVVLINASSPFGYPVSGNGTLTKITFNATSAEPASCTLNLYDTFLINSSENPIPHEVEDGEYRFLLLALNVATNKLLYSILENVTIHGNLTLGNVTQQVLVALEVDNPYRIPLIIRTLKTGPTPPPEDIDIVEIYPSTQYGDPQDSFAKGGSAYFYVSVRNNSTQTKSVTVTVTAFDSSMTPLLIPSWSMFPLAAKSQAFVILSVPIPMRADAGNGTAYASVLTGLPSQGGIPYCPEKNATFQIIGGGAGPGASSPSALPGNYNLTFKLANDTLPGVYRTHVVSYHMNRILTDRTTFGVDAIVVPIHYPTIQQAVDAATPTNYSIMVLSGTYNELVTINKTVILAGMGASDTIINGTGTGNVITVTGNNVRINGFTIENGGSSSNGGIVLVNSSDSNISENVITSNSGYGILLNHSVSVTLQDNSLVCNKYNLGVFGDSLSHFDHTIDTSNTVDGKPVIYWVNEQGQTVPSNAGFVAIVNSEEIILRDLDLTKNGQGVLFAFANDSLIERVNVTNNDYGLYLFRSNGNTIVGCEVSNSTVGIYQRDSNESMIYHNNFVNNTDQADLLQSLNTWDNGDGEGNYWSDYTGLDDGTGGRPAGDGVGDTNLPHQGVDWYPLMNYYVPKHDIAVLNVTHVLPYPSVYPGMVIDVSVTAKNRGDFAETFFITGWYDGNPFDTELVGLLPQEVTVVDLTWDTTGVSPGTYTLSANTSAIPGETYTDNNLYVDGNVTLLVPTVHDIAVTNVTLSKTMVNRGFLVNVTVVLKNEGHFKETFNVTANANETLIIDTRTIILRPLANVTVTIPWNTTGVALGNYTISANATVVSGEINTANNIFIDGTVEVVLWGDVNGNGVIDLGDIGKVILIYSGIITEPEWMILRADINENGTVDLGDIGKVILIYSGVLP